jgi:hypothetical protein
MVLDAVQSPHTRRNYAKALDDLFQFCASRPLVRTLHVPGPREHAKFEYCVPRAIWQQAVAQLGRPAIP